MPLQSDTNNCRHRHGANWTWWQLSACLSQLPAIAGLPDELCSNPDGFRILAGT